MAINSVKRPAEPFIELRIADGDRSRKQKSRSACTDEGFSNGTNRAVVGKQNASLCKTQRLLSKTGDQPRSQGIGKRAVRRDCIDGDPLRVRHPLMPLR